MKFREYVAQTDSIRLKRQVVGAFEILARLFSVPSVKEERSPKAHEQADAFWMDPSSPLFDWLRSHGVPSQPGVVPPHASGAVGRVYFVGGNYVVKASTNAVEANVAKMVAGRDDIPTPIIDVLPLKSPFYAILQHYVNTNVSAELKRAADFLMVVIDNHPDMQGFPRDRSQQETLCLEVLKKYKGSPSLLGNMLLLMGVINQLYQNTGFFHDDAGPTNIAMHQGKVVIPDLGPNEPGGFSADKTLSRIDRNRANLGLPPRSAI